MKSYFAYIRVSTAKQGEQGVSLQEQRDAIKNYAQKNNLTVAEWFEEKESAAKRGRPVFSKMIKLLKKGKVNGLIVHKIDRSARNLKDWAELGELIDQGIEVHFANENLDLHTRGGRLSADIQAVVAADYIRNLKEETRKGFYGRLKQGLYPLPAPIGYLDKGKGKPKEPDPMKAPLIRKAFELYSTGQYNLHSLAEEMYRLGLRNRNNGRVTVNGLSVILNNPFYIGLIRLKKTKEIFPGVHNPLVSKYLFDCVQAILSGKLNSRTLRHDFIFRRMLRCRHCNYSLIGEVQKGHIYYRCHTKTCPTTCIREEKVEEKVREKLSLLQFSEKEMAYLKSKVNKLKDDWVLKRQSQINALRLSIRRLEERLNRLTDAYIDGILEKELFEQRKTALLMEKRALEEKLFELKEKENSIPEKIAEFLELAGNAYFSYKMAIPEEKRDLLKIITSNRFLDGKHLEIELNLPFSEIANHSKCSNGGPYQERPRTALDSLFEKLYEYFTVMK